MCDPTTALVAMGGAGAMSAYGQYQSGKFNADMANAQAGIAEQSSRDALTRGAADANAALQQANKTASSQRVAMAAGGVDVGSGTALDVLADTASAGAFDAAIAKNNAAREAYGYQVQAAMSRAEAKQARRQGNMGAVSSIMTTGASVYKTGKEMGQWK